MGRKRLGTDLELNMVKKAFKGGGFGFRAPGSGTFTPLDEGDNRNKEQEKCSIQIDVPHVDRAFKDAYITADYWAWFGEWEDARVVEAKTIRAKKKKGERQDPKKTRMIGYYYLTEIDKKEFLGRGKNKVKNENHGKLKKSDFCIELERAMLLADRMDGSGIFNIPVRAYLHVRFIGSLKEKFFHVPNLLKDRKNDQDVLKVIKDEHGIITHKWQERT